MGKEKKKSLGIKTSRYFTKTCSACKFKYPSWFVNCPKCGAAWDEYEPDEATAKGEPSKKTIKIVVKITEEDFNEALANVQLMFSADQGRSWFQMKMENKLDYFIAELAEVPTGSIIIYYIEVTLASGEKVIENNEGKYFFYKVGAPLDESDKLPQKPKPPPEKILDHVEPKQPIMDSHKERLFTETPPKYFTPQKSPSFQPPQTPINFEKDNKTTIFGRPQTQVDPNLKICPHCNSKIKKIWSTCPIYGKSL